MGVAHVVRRLTKNGWNDRLRSPPTSKRPGPETRVNERGSRPELASYSSLHANASMPWQMAVAFSAFDPWFASSS